MNSMYPNPSLAQKLFNLLLWTLQIVWGIFFSFTGFGKIFAADPSVWHRMVHQVAWFSAVPAGLFVFIGICEGLGGVALIVPAMTRVAPKLTPIAAAGLALIMVFAGIFHIMRGEYSFFLPLNLVLGGVAAVIAVGRFAMPIQPAPMGTFRAATGLAISALLALAGFAPIWYQYYKH